MSAFSKLFDSSRSQDVGISGGASPRTGTGKRTVFTTRGAGRVIPNNAPAHNYRANAIGNQELSGIQRVYLDALRNSKLSGKRAGNPSWIGKSFG